MDRSETGRLVEEELRHIPGGACGPFQRMLRLEYRRTRLRHLAANPSTSRDLALSEAVARARTLFPSATFVYDETFFEVWAPLALTAGRPLPGYSATRRSGPPSALLPTGNVIELN